jgi:hypothetical protein
MRELPDRTVVNLCPILIYLNRNPISNTDIMRLLFYELSIVLKMVGCKKQLVKFVAVLLLSEWSVLDGAYVSVLFGRWMVCSDRTKKSEEAEK